MSRAVVASPMTIAVSTKACGKGSTYILAGSAGLTIGATPPSMYPSRAKKRKVLNSITDNEIAILTRFLCVTAPYSPTRNNIKHNI
jgi:hypothetical protein